MTTIKSFNYLPDEARDIRKQVFVDEQGFENEFDDIDGNAVHFLCFYNGNAVGTCRVFKRNEETTYIVGRVAVLANHRGKDIGLKLMRECERFVAKSGGKSITVSAQVRASGFYEKAGFERVGDVYDEDGCPHIKMVKRWR